MKKTLLFVLMCLCATMSAWAQVYSGEAKTWISCDNSSVQETAFIFTINTPGKLSEALASTQSTYQIAKIKGELNAEDIATLSSITAETIDLQDAYYMENGEKKAFTFTNSSVRNLILPDNWTKAEVNAAAQAVNANLGSAISLGTFKDADGSDFASGSTFAGKTEITAYVNTSKTLRDVLIRTYSEGNNTKFASSCNKDNFTMDNVYGITISGYAVAQDFSKKSLDFTAEGHLVFDREANEKERNKANDTRTIVGTGANKKPAFYCNTLGPGGVVSLDLSGVIIDDIYNSDLTLSESGLIGADTRQVCIPTYSGFNTIPADFLYVDGNGVHQICIPGNIKNIKTRAFHRTRLDHVWTTGTTENMKYDNGIFIASGSDEVEHDGQLSFNNATNYLYGTYTLPEGLKLIESNAFCYEQDAKIKDVYSLAIETPECHVDAFSTINYHGNNTFNSSGINSEGIITRDAYIRGELSTRHYITMLHFPRECGTPYVQRYTDPTRDYSIATGDVDGNGSPIYFPNQCEFDRAYNQGTTGYLWDAWDPTRDDNGSGKFSNTTIDSYNVFGTWDETSQAQANGVYAGNTTTPAETLQFTSFYDVTADGLYNQPQSPTPLVPYYNVYRGGGALHDGNTTGSYTQLYPAPETEPVLDEQGHQVYESVPVKDAYGEIEYDEAVEGATYEGNYTRTAAVRYDKASDGNYCHPVTIDNNGQYTLGYKYIEDPEGEWVDNPGYPGHGQWQSYQDYMATQYPGIKRYKKVVSGLVPFTDQWGQDRYNIGEDYVLYEDCAFEYKSILDRYNRRDSYDYTPATSSDEGPFYTMRTQQVAVMQVTKANDYRGWHQFVLTGYAHNSELNFEPLKSYISDNDWWTICAPYDLRRSDLILLFGDKNNPQNLPYLSKLVYVVRDVEKGKITLMFSKNLMVYKEYVEENGEKKSINDPNDLQKSGTYVHGIVDDTEWTAAEIAEDPIILHRGVPYLIKPYMSKDNDGKFNRQFDIYSENQPTDLVVPTGAIVNEWLYQSFKTARSLDGDTQKKLIYDGEYQVPAYVINNSDDVESTISEITIKMNLNGVTNQGPSFTYSESSSDDPFIFKGVSYPDAVNGIMKVSDEFRYTFVGTFYKSLMPEFSYFLGWNKNLNGGKGGAAFYYNRVVNTRDYNWNNETGIICANWSLAHTIEAAKATDLIPAQWKSSGSGMENDDYPTTTTTQNPAKSYMDMEFGNSMSVIYKEEMGIATRVQDIPSSVVGDGIVYDIHGVKMGTSLHGLAKGVYVVNGKKYVVK